MTQEQNCLQTNHCLIMAAIKVVRFFYGIQLNRVFELQISFASDFEFSILHSASMLCNGNEDYACLSKIAVKS